MKILKHVRKYVFELAGVPTLEFDGYRTPYHVYRRVFPFIYRYLGTCSLAHWDKPEDLDEWIKEKEGE